MEINGRQPVDDLIPGVFELYKHGCQQLWKNKIKLLLIFFIAFIIQLLGGFLGLNILRLPFSLGIAYTCLVCFPVNYGVLYTFLRAVRGDRLTIMDLFKFTGNYWNVVVASIITNLIIVYGMILLILPGIIFGCKLAFTPFLVVDLRMNAFKAIKTSWQMTKGHAYKIFFINLLIIIPIFLCWTPIASAISESSFWFIPFLLIILIIILIGLALASLYHFIVISEDLSGGNNIDNTID